MNDNRGSWRQDASARQLVRLIIEPLSQNDLLRIYYIVDAVVGPSRSGKIIAEAASRCLKGEYPWDPSVGARENLINAVVAGRAREIIHQLPDTMAKLEKEVSGDNLVSKVLSALQGGISEEAVKELLGISSQQYRAQLDRILQGLRRLAGEKEPPSSDRIAHIEASAERIWEDPENARHFLTTPHRMLRGMTPLEAAVTEDGARLVEQILTSLEGGLTV